MKVTMQHIADEVGVTKMTVSNAYSKPDRVSAQLRERIFDAARRLGYTGPDAAARAFARGTSGVVGVILTDSPAEAFTDDTAVAFMAAIAETLSERALAMALVPGRTTTDRVPARDLALDGAIVYGCSAHSAAFQTMLERGLPLVTVDQQPVDEISAVNIDDYGGARYAAEYLARHGHRDIAAITVDGPDNGFRGHTTERLRGWRDGLAGRGLRLAARPGALSEVDGYELALGLLEAPQRPTAFVCFSDVVALGALRAARQLGISVPGELSIIGFDDSPAAARAELTTVHQDVRAKGHAAVHALYQAMDSSATTTGQVQRILLPTQLTVRHSTAPPRQDKNK